MKKQIRIALVTLSLVSSQQALAQNDPFFAKDPRTNAQLSKDIDLQQLAVFNSCRLQKYKITAGAALEALPLFGLIQEQVDALVHGDEFVKSYDGQGGLHSFAALFGHAPLMGAHYAIQALITLGVAGGDLLSGSEFESLERLTTVHTVHFNRTRAMTEKKITRSDSPCQRDLSNLTDLYAIQSWRKGKQPTHVASGAYTNTHMSKFLSTPSDVSQSQKESARATRASLVSKQVD